MRAYVAGKTHDFERVREVQALVRRAGYEITHDWTVEVERNGPNIGGSPDERVSVEERKRYAELDRDGVIDANCVVVVTGHENLVGTLIEVGIAVSTLKPVFVLGRFPRYSIFWELDNFTFCDDEEALKGCLGQLEMELNS